MKKIPYIPAGAKRITQEELSTYLLPADVGFSRTGSDTGAQIRWLTQHPREPLTYAQHTLGVGTRDNIVEALFKVRSFPIEEWALPEEFEVWRHVMMTDDERLTIAETVESHVGTLYGAGRIPIFAIDGILSRVFRRDVSFFRRHFLTNQGFPICSFLYGRAYEKTGWDLSGCPASQASPDDQHDYCKRMPVFKMAAKRYADASLWVFEAKPY